LNGAAPSLDDLARLATSADIYDRAFAASALRLHPHDRAHVSALYELVRETASAQHAAVRKRIREGTLDREAFLAELHAAPLDIRDHLLEEILDVAYPPLDASALPRELIDYSPSGLAEILFAVDNASLGPGATFVDLGSGVGKVVLVVALLTGAIAHGIELDPVLVERARASARALGLENARFVEGDMRDVALPAADVYYMYIPVIHSRDLAARVATAAADRKALLFAQPLDVTHLSWRRVDRGASYWLAMYERA
jgi:SAM-dependent methyltransferase